MKEKILRVGETTKINGVVTLADASGDQKLCVLILNSGLMHHVGTSRISVTLARQLAGMGVSSARFDFSGIGDSPPKRGSTNFTENARSDVQEVIDAMARDYGFEQFILYGLCSGADVSFYVAQADSRIVGIAQIDPYLYKTAGWYIRHYLPRLFSLSTWLTFFKKVGQSLPASSNEQSNSPELPEDSRTIPPKQEVVEGYQKLLAGGCRILVIITGGQLYTFNHKEQFRACFNQVDWADRLEEHFYPEAEHILPEPLYQEKVSQNICQWIASFLRAAH